MPHNDKVDANVVVYTGEGGNVVSSAKKTEDQISLSSKEKTFILKEKINFYSLGISEKCETGLNISLV